MATGRRRLAAATTVVWLDVALPGHAALAQSVPAPVPPTLEGVPSVAALPRLVVTGSRVETDPFDLPFSLDVVGADAIHDGQLQVNLSESMQRVPGINVQSRSNYAQDLQMSIRGFGARSTFGVRGIKLLYDGIPASQPDGQGQVAHFALTTADRIEVVRGPFSVLYGNASGGVIQLFSADPPAVAQVTPSAAAGSDGTWRAGFTAGGRSGATGYLAGVDRFSTDGFRPQSAATRDNAMGKLEQATGERTQLTLLANYMDVPLAQDPLGLTRSAFDANPDSTDPVAIQFDTRKSYSQSQAGLAVRHEFARGIELRGVAYVGQRDVRQYQAIPTAPQNAPTHPGGVIDLERVFYGVDARVIAQFAPAGVATTLVAGVNVDAQDEQRRGYQNFVGSTLGVLGALRRDEENRTTSADVYAQADVTLAPAWSAFAGVRTSTVRLKSEDRYVVPGNPDDSGSADYRKTTPAVGVVFKPSPGWRLYASAGRGFETPTFNEVAYRPGGQTGLNLELRPAVTDSVELGAKWRSGSGAQATLAVHESRTDDEIAVLTNSGGRSTFQNAGKTLRRGLEASWHQSLSAGFDLFVSATLLKAVYDQDFLTCTAAPCNVPSTRVPSGNRIPGIPDRSAYAELRWSEPGGWSAALEVKHQGRMWVDDLNTDSANPWTIASLRAGYETQLAAARLNAFVRLDNLFDHRYAASVIVNEGNARYFEPAPGRGWLVGASAAIPF
jgi:iron complex outermembrane receptor protein